MAVFPGAIPTFAGFTSTHTLAEDNHAAQHNLEQAEMVQIATKLGTGSSTPSVGTILKGTGPGTSAWQALDMSTDLTGTLPVNRGGTGVTTQAEQAAIIGALLYPVGAIYTAVVSTNPGTLLGFGTWTAFGAGKVPVGIDSGDTDFDTVEETGGAKTHTLSIAEMPSHDHDTGINFGSGAGAVYGALDRIGDSNNDKRTGFTGGGGAHNNLQPYIVVYMWKRTA